MGGGRREFLTNVEQDIEGTSGKRTDGINLINEWQQKHRRHNAHYVQTKDELLNVSSRFVATELAVLDFVGKKTLSTHRELVDAADVFFETLFDHKNLMKACVRVGIFFLIFRARAGSHSD